MAVSLRRLWPGARARRSPAVPTAVVLPDETYVPEGPWVRPTHSGGLTSGPRPVPSVAVPLVARPRVPLEDPVEVALPERAAQA